MELDKATDEEIEDLIKGVPDEQKQWAVDQIFGNVHIFTETYERSMPTACPCIQSDILKRCTTDEVKAFMKIIALFGFNVLDGLADEHIEQCFSKDKIAAMYAEAENFFQYYGHAYEELSRRELEFHVIGEDA